VRNVALPIVGGVHLEILEKTIKGHVRAPERLPLVRWR
jgi:hypothetical protein